MHAQDEHHTGRGVGDDNTPFERARRLVTALLLRWPHEPHVECPSLLLGGQTGNGKSYLVDCVANDCANTAERSGSIADASSPTVAPSNLATSPCHDRLRIVTPDLAPLLTMRECDGGTGLRRHLRRTIRHACVPLNDEDDDNVLSGCASHLPHRTRSNTTARVPSRSSNDVSDVSHTNNLFLSDSRMAHPIVTSCCVNDAHAVCYSVLVVLDHMEFFVHAEAGESGTDDDAAATGMTGAAAAASFSQTCSSAPMATDRAPTETMSLTHSDFVTDLYTVLHSSPALFDAAEVAALRLRRIVYLSLFTVDTGSGSHAATPLFFPDQIHRFARDHCFDFILTLPTPSEAERRCYFATTLSSYQADACDETAPLLSAHDGVVSMSRTEPGTHKEEVDEKPVRIDDAVATPGQPHATTPLPPTPTSTSTAATPMPATQQQERMASSMMGKLAESLAMRTGGITYAGLAEIVDELTRTLDDMLDSVSRLVLLQRTPPDTERDVRDQADDVLRAMAAAETHRLVKSFRSSSSVAAQEYRCSVGYVDVQQTRWHDIAGMEEVKQWLQRLVTAPLKRRALYQRCGVRPCTGVLLHGPPGTGKTMLAKAMATELNASFVYLNLPDLLQAEVGESEHVLEQFFATARERSPTVMFIDELQAAFGVRYNDAHRSSRATGYERGSHADDTRNGCSDSMGGYGAGSDTRDSRRSPISAHDTRLVSNLLYHLDMAQQDEQHMVLFVGATNVVHLLDKQILRAGRLDTWIEVPLPDRAARMTLMQNIVYGEWACWFDGDDIVPCTRIQDKTPAKGGTEPQGLEVDAREQATCAVPDLCDASAPCRPTRSVRETQEWLIDLMVERTDGMSGATVRNIATLFALHMIREVTTELAASRATSEPPTPKDVRAELFRALASETPSTRTVTRDALTASSRRARVQKILEKTLRSYAVVSI